MSRDVIYRGEVIVVCVTNKTNFRSNDLGTCAAVTTDHRRARHQCFHHSQSERFVELRREEKTFRAGEQLSLLFSTNIADISRANFAAHFLDLCDSLVTLARACNDEFEPELLRDGKNDVESFLRAPVHGGHEQEVIVLSLTVDVFVRVDAVPDVSIVTV